MHLCSKYFHTLCLSLLSPFSHLSLFRLPPSHFFKGITPLSPSVSHTFSFLLSSRYLFLCSFIFSLPINRSLSISQMSLIILRKNSFSSVLSFATHQSLSTHVPLLRSPRVIDPKVCNECRATAADAVVQLR